MLCYPLAMINYSALQYVNFVSFKTTISLLVLALFSIPANSEQTLVCDEDASCIAENSWKIGIAIGLGGRTNPLVDGDTIPLLIVPDIAYYAESAYFDNGELGWQLLPSPTTSIEFFVAPNFEQANFSFWHTANLLAPSSLNENSPDPGADGSEPPIGEQPDWISVDDIASRDWAFDAGFRWQWYSDNHHFSVSVAHDASKVYEDAHASIKYQYLTQLKGWHIRISPFLKWYSDGLTDYYYGISERDTQSGEFIYTASGGLQYGLSLYAAYKINANWHGLVRANLTQLHSGMTDSPLVEDNSIYTAFAGFAYRF